MRRLDSNLNGGPNPQGVSVGIETTARVQHGFTLTAAGVFTAFDPPGHIDFPQFHQPGGGDRGSIPRGNAGKLLMHPTLLMTNCADPIQPAQGPDSLFKESYMQRESCR